MRSRTPLPARGQGQVRPFLEAAVLFAALCIFARSAALGLAAAITAPLPMAETLLWLGRQAAGETASSVQEQAEPESVPQGPASSLPQAVQALPGSIEDYLVPLLGEDARPDRERKGSGDERQAACVEEGASVDGLSHNRMLLVFGLS